MDAPDAPDAPRNAAVSSYLPFPWPPRPITDAFACGLGKPAMADLQTLPARP